MLSLARLRSIGVSVFAAVFAALAAGCGTGGPATAPPGGAAADRVRLAPEEAEVSARVRTAAAPWRNVPYRFGGKDRSGVDCSAFTRAVMADAFGLRLPRTTASQVLRGAPVAAEALRAGDLVFFRTGPDQRHVGVYLGGGDFVHASTSGVRVSSLRRGYYRRKYWTARRVLPGGLVPAAPPAAAAPPPPAVRPAAAGPARTGW